MQKIISFVSQSPDWPRLAVLLGTMFLFWNIENANSVLNSKGKWKHALRNALFVIPAAPVQFIIGFILIFFIDWDSRHQFGLFQNHFFRIHSVADLLVAIVLLDFFEYVYHVMMHRVKRFWMFHLIHHSDEQVDVSTTLREHPAETLIRLSFSVILILVLGVPFWIVMLRQWIQIAFNVIQHSGFRLHYRSDKVLRLFFITPNMHHVHHHRELPYTDSNYGDIFSFWDRLFGTFRKIEDHKVEYGIDTLHDPEENHKFSRLMLIPFGKYRSGKQK